MIRELLAKFQFWNAKKLEHGKHYEFFLNLSNEEAFSIKILKEYPGVIIEFINVHMSSETDITFDQQIIANPNLCNVESQRFKNFTAMIFRSIINNAIGAIGNELKDHTNENRDADSFQLDKERSIYEEVSSVSKERVPNRKPRKKTVRRDKKLHSEVQQPSTDSSVKDQFEGIDQTD